MAVSNCPTCGTTLNGRSICPRCGTLVGAELAVANATAKAKSLIDRQVGKLGSLGPAHFLWIAAVIPVVIAPPLVSFAVSIISMRRPERAVNSVNYEWIAIISTVNLILSALILYKFHFSPTELHGFLVGVVRGLVDRIVPILPGQVPRPRVVPI